MAQKDEMSPRALEMEELENVNGGVVLPPFLEKVYPRVGNPLIYPREEAPL